MSVEESNKLEMQRLFQDIGNDLKDVIVKTLEEEGKEVFGEAIKSVQYFADDNVVGSLLDYMFNIEFGREAGSHVPLQPLHDWAVEKLGLDDESAWATARRIENKIYSEGIEMTRAWKISLERFRS